MHFQVTFTAPFKPNQCIQTFTSCRNCTWRAAAAWEELDSPPYLNESSAGWRWPWPAAGLTPTAGTPPQRWPSGDNFGHRCSTQSGRSPPPRCVLLPRGWSPCTCGPSLPESWARHWESVGNGFISPCWCNIKITHWFHLKICIYFATYANSLRLKHP